MTKKISDTKPVIEFTDVASNFCLLLENRDEYTAVRLLQKVFIILPQLCLCGMNLPDIERLSDYEPSRMSHEQWKDLYKTLQYKFKDYDVYTQIFDAYGAKDQDPIQKSLSDDLSDIYGDIKGGLQDWEKATAADKLNIIWYWKLEFETHWGHHAVSALRALYSLLYNHIEGEYELYIGIREEK